MLLFSSVNTTTWFEEAFFFALFWAPSLFVEHLRLIFCNHCMKFLTKSTGLFCPKTGKLITLIIISNLFENQKYLKVFNTLMWRLLDRSVFLCVYNNIEDDFFQLHQHWAPLLFVKHFDFEITASKYLTKSTGLSCAQTTALTVFFGTLSNYESSLVKQTHLKVLNTSMLGPLNRSVFLMTILQHRRCFFLCTCYQHPYYLLNTLILCNHCIKVFNKEYWPFLYKKGKPITLTIVSHFWVKYQLS